MPLLRRIALMLDIKKDEGWFVTMLFIHAFINGLALVFLQTSSYTIFLKHFQASQLPFIYILVAIFGTLATFGCLYVEENLSFQKYLSFILVLCLGFTLAFKLALELSGTKWVAFALPVWAEVYWCLLSVELSSALGSALNVRQSKRLLGLIMSGVFIAQVLGGLSIGTCTRLFGLNNLILMAFIWIFLNTLFLEYLFRVFPDKFESAGDEDDGPEADELAGSTSSNLRFLKEKYILLAFFIYSLSIFVDYFLDNAFYDLVAIQYPQEVLMADFLGKFSAAAGVCTMFSLVFFSSFILNNYGVLVGLLILPITAIIGSVCVLGTQFMQGPFFLIFVFLALTQLAKMVLSEGIYGPAQSVLYQVLPKNKRTWALSTNDGIVDPVAGGLAGVILYLLMNQLHYKAPQLCWVILVTCIIWIIASYFSYQEYMSALEKALAKRRYGHFKFDIQDRSSISLVLSGLKSDFIGEIFFSLNTLQDNDYKDIGSVFIELLEHPNERVRLEVLKRIELFKRIELLNEVEILKEVKKCFESDQSDKVRAQAIITYVSLGHDIFEEVKPYVDSQSNEIQLGALCALLKYGGIEGTLFSGNYITQMFDSKDPGRREQAAKILGVVELSSF
ncbi:hypothetical protein ACFL35_14580, partial [Candidatus Riflebacteria bacterium]